MLAVLVFFALSSVGVFSVNPVSASSATVQTDKSSYVTGSTVVVYGSGFGPNKSIGITITDPSGRVASGSVISDKKGHYAASYALDTLAGSYSVVASNGNTSATSTFAASSNPYSFPSVPVVVNGLPSRPSAIYKSGGIQQNTATTATAAPAPATPVIVSQSPATSVYPEHTAVSGFGIEAPAAPPLIAVGQRVQATTNAPPETHIPSGGASPATSTTARIWTDKTDYAPYSTVLTFGSGFLPNAQVTLTLLNPDGSNATWTTTTDGNGTLATSYTLQVAGLNFVLTATDGTNTATTTFTDAASAPTDQTTGVSGGTSQTPTCAYGVAPTTNDLLVVAFMVSPDTVTMSGVPTDTLGNTFALVKSEDATTQGAPHFEIYIYAAMQTHGATGDTITLHFGSAPAASYLTCWEAAGVTSTVYGSPVVGTGASSSGYTSFSMATAPLTPEANDLVYAFAAYQACESSSGPTYVLTGMAAHGTDFSEAPPTTCFHSGTTYKYSVDNAQDEYLLPTSTTATTAGMGIAFGHASGSTGGASSLGWAEIGVDFKAQNSPTIATSLSHMTIDATQSVTDSATLTGATSSAGGSVSYYYYSNNACSAGQTPVNTVAVSNGVVPTSNSQTFSSAGSFSWNAVYSGDPNNQGATSLCEALTVNAALGTPTVTPSQTTIDNGQSIGVQVSWGGGTSSYSVHLYRSLTSTCTTGSTSAGTQTGQASSPYTFSGLTPSANTWYCATVTDSAGTPVTSSVSTAVEVVVNAAPTQSPPTATHNPADVGQSVTFTAVVSGGTGTGSYAWSYGLLTGCTASTTSTLTCVPTATFSGTVSFQWTDGNGIAATGTTALAFTVNAAVSGVTLGSFGANPQLVSSSDNIQVSWSGGTANYVVTLYYTTSPTSCSSSGGTAASASGVSTTSKSLTFTTPASAGTYLYCATVTDAASVSSSSSGSGTELTVSSTVPEFPYGVVLLVIPVAFMFYFIRGRPRPLIRAAPR